MSFELFGFGASFFIDSPVSLVGYGLMVCYALAAGFLLWRARFQFTQLTGRQWAAFICLALASVLLAQFAILYFPANILPPPGVPTEPHRPGLALFALVPAFLASGLGFGPALLIGGLAGLSRAMWETHSWATLFEFGLAAALVAWAAGQDYRGRLSAGLRHPLLAGLVGAGVLWPLLFLSYYAYSQAPGLVGWDYVASLVQAAAPVYAAHIVLAGLAAEFVRLGQPGWWPRRRGGQPPPYLYSLNRKLLFALIPLFLFGLGLLFWANVTIATRVSTNLVVDQLAMTAENAGEEIPLFINNGHSLMSDAAKQYDWLAANATERAVWMAEMMRTLPFFRQVTLFDVSQTPIGGFPLGAADNFGSEGDEGTYLTWTLQGSPQDGVVFLGASADVLFTAPVVDPASGEVRAVLVGRADMQTNPLMKAVTGEFDGLVGGQGQGFIVDADNHIIYHPDPSRLQEEFQPEPSARTLATRLSEARAYQDRAPDGTRRLVLIYPVPTHPWTLVLMAPNAVALELATQIATPVISILLLIGVSGLIIVSLIAGRLARPAEALALAAQRISEGKLDQPVVVAGEDEIGRAGLAFENMRDKLRARLDELSLLLRTSRGVTASLDLRQALPAILEGALNVTGAGGVRLALLPAEESSSGELASPQSFAIGPASDAMAALDRGVLALMRDQERVVLEHPARARTVLDVGSLANRLQAIVALPLRQENTYYGALWLGFEKPHVFADAELNFLTTLAGQAAVAVANARLFEAAEQRRQRLAAILASTPDAVIVTDRGDRLALLNPAAEAAFDLIGKPSIGRPLAQVLALPALVKLLQENTRVGETEEVALGSGRTLYASASPIVGSDGAILGRVCVLRDVTRFKELDAMKSEFVATVSHDLRAPLTFMRGYATMLPMVGTLNDKQREFGEKIITGIEQMTKLIDDLLDLGRIEAGVGLAREMVRVDELVAGLVENVQPQSASRGLSVTADIPLDLPPISGDPTLLRQAFTNLVDNAIKYTPNGGQVQVRLAIQGDRFRLAIMDSGLGISPADQLHLFEKFFRVKQRGSSQVKGSGLGLAIVKSIIERHGGRVYVESQLGRGSTFHIELPVNGPPPEPPT